MAANINKYIGISDEQMQSILSSRAFEPPPHLQHSNSEDVDFQDESDNLHVRQSLQMLSTFRSQAQQSHLPLTPLTPTPPLTPTSTLDILESLIVEVQNLYLAC